MAQHDYVLDNQSGALFRADANSALQAIVTNNSGATAPSPTFANQNWFDTANSLWKQRNNGNTAWEVVARKDADGITPYTQGGQALPPGIIMAYAGATEPTGWVFCYGQALSRTTYFNLFTAIGTAYGVGDGSTTFTLPDLRDRVPLGKGNMGGADPDRITKFTTTTLGGTGGVETIEAHTHTGPSHVHAFSHTHTLTHIHGAGNYQFDSSPFGITALSGTVSCTTIFQSAGAGNAAPAHASVGGTVAVTFGITRSGTITLGGTSGAANTDVTSGPSVADTSAGGTETTGSSGTGTHGVLQPCQVVNYIIKL